MAPLLAGRLELHRGDLTLACTIAVREVAAALRAHDLPARVVFCAFDEETAQLYRRALADLGAPPTPLPGAG